MMGSPYAVRFAGLCLILNSFYLPQWRQFIRWIVSEVVFELFTSCHFSLLCHLMKEQWVASTIFLFVQFMTERILPLRGRMSCQFILAIVVFRKKCTEGIKKGLYDVSIGMTNGSMEVCYICITRKVCSTYLSEEHVTPTLVAVVIRAPILSLS